MNWPDWLAGLIAGLGIGFVIAGRDVERAQKLTEKALDLGWKCFGAQNYKGAKCAEGAGVAAVAPPFVSGFSTGTTTEIVATPSSSGAARGLTVRLSTDGTLGPASPASTPRASRRAPKPKRAASSSKATGRKRASR